MRKTIKLYCPIFVPCDSENSGFGHSRLRGNDRETRIFDVTEHQAAGMDIESLRKRHLQIARCERGT